MKASERSINLPATFFNAVWSATPTPFTDDMRIDAASVERMVRHQLQLGVKGLFLAGSCGEGPWMRDRERNDLVKLTCGCKYDSAALVSVQVTENSSDRVLVNIDAAAANGADLAVVASPYFLMHATPRNLLHFYQEIMCRSALPLGIYDRGAAASIPIPIEIMEEIYSDPKVVLVKDSSSDPQRRRLALAIRKRRDNLYLLNGNEFDCITPLQAGYDGLLLGGGIFNGAMAEAVRQAVAAGDVDRANQLQNSMNELMWKVYGGKEITCWMSGLKYLLLRMGIFTAMHSYLRYPLTESYRTIIDRLVETERDVLFPYEL